MATNNTTRMTTEYPCWYRNRNNGPYDPCKYAGKGSTFVLSYLNVMLFIFVSYKLIHFIFQPYGLPRFFSQLTAGILLGNISFMEEVLNTVVGNLLPSLIELGMDCYLLVLGLEMDLTILLQRPTPPEAIVAYIGVLTTFIVTAIVTPLIKIGVQNTLLFHLSLSLLLTGTSGSLLTRLVTDLKMVNSDIGRLIIGAGNYTDIVTMILLSAVRAFHHTLSYKDSNTTVTVITERKFGEGCFTMFMILVVIITLAKVLSIIVNWIEERNPEGKPVRGSDLIVLGGIMFILFITVPAVLGYSAAMSCFLIGLTFPRKGRISKMLIGRINEFLNFLVFPLYFGWIGAYTNLRCLLETAGNDKYIWMIKFLFLYILVMMGKVLGAILSGMFLGFNWTVAIAIGFFLNVKGHFHIFVAAFALHQEQVSRGSFFALMLFAILSIGLIPYLAKFITKRGANNRNNTRRAIQWVNPSDELRMLLCIHGLQNVPTMINMMEVSRGNTDHEISAYVTDMIEINGCNTTSMVVQPDHNHQEFHNENGGGGGGSATMPDETVVNMREEISNAILSYVERRGKGIKVHRLLAISTFANMHQDLFNLADAVQASLLILPYHRNQRKDGKMDNVHHGFRYVNRKVLRQAPCSIGILVDRGFGSINKGSSSIVTIQVAVIFIGGKDDREALAYATRIAQHPEIKLTAIRFIKDSNAEKTTSRAKKPRSVRLMDEQELKLDDEYFAEFYEKKVAHGKVGYVENHVMNGKDMVSTLKSYEGQYALFIVGRADRVNCILTAGMSNWEECPDLGPLGEILADSDFSTTASVLVIQQHTHDELENGFKVM